jgi:hypothetical protein
MRFGHGVLVQCGRGIYPPPPSFLAAVKGHATRTRLPVEPGGTSRRPIGGECRRGRGRDGPASTHICAGQMPRQHRTSGSFRVHSVPIRRRGTGQLWRGGRTVGRGSVTSSPTPRSRRRIWIGRARPSHPKGSGCSDLSGMSRDDKDPVLRTFDVVPTPEDAWASGPSRTGYRHGALTVPHAPSDGPTPRPTPSTKRPFRGTAIRSCVPLYSGCGVVLCAPQVSTMRARKGVAAATPVEAFVLLAPPTPVARRYGRVKTHPARRQIM